jgi:outer membrane receptor protein involved in Fe transport
MPSGISRVVVCVVSSFVFCFGGFAQSDIARATLNGTVTDPTGAVVSGAKITVADPQTGFTRESVTTDAGLYNFTGLPVGTYDVAVETSGFKTAKKAGVRLAVGAVATLDFTLEVGATAETVEVTSQLPVVETTRSQTSTTVDTRAVADLPVNGRNFLDFTTLTPGVVRDPTRGGDLSFGGQRGTQNSLLVDGSDANNTFFGQSTGRAGSGRSPYSFSQDAVEEFQVNTNGYAAEIGRAGGGVINVITKSGTNAFHGDLFEFYRDKALNANSWENNQRGIPRRNYHFNQFGGNIGGPIVRDKLFFFFDYDGQRNSTPNPVFIQVAPPPDALSQAGYQAILPFVQSYANTLNNDTYLGKVDWNITEGQRLSIRYDANRFTGQNYENSGFSSALSHTGNSNVTTDNIAGNYSWTVTPTSVLEARVAYTRDDEPGAANSTMPETIVKQNGLTALSFGRNSFSPRYTNATTLQFAPSLSVVRGAHTFKFGVDVIRQKIDNYFPGNFSGSFTFNSYADFAADRPALFVQAFAGPNTSGPLSKPNANEYAGFLQDSWHASRRFTLNYGLRYDFFEYAEPAVFNPDPQLAAININTARINRDYNNVAPRIGIAYALNDKGTSVIRAGYGTFYGRTPSIFTGTAFTQNGIQVQGFSFSSAAGPIPTAYPNLLPSIPNVNRTPDIFVFAHDYVQPLTHQWSFNLEHQLGSSVSITLGYLGVRGEHLSRSRDINLYPEIAMPGTLSTGGAITYYQHPRVRPVGDFGRITLAESGANSIYHGAFIQVTKRMSNNFQVQVSYTWSKVIDDAPDQTAVVVGADDTKIVQDTLNPGADRAVGNANVPHRFVFSGIWDLNYVPASANGFIRAVLGGWELGTIAQIQSGRPFSPFVNVDLNQDGNSSNDRAPGAGRNSIRGPNFLTDDVRLTKRIPLFGERVYMQLIGEAFNITNRANYSLLRTTQYNFAGGTFSPTPGYLTPTATYDPRILQLAAKIRF